MIRAFVVAVVLASLPVVALANPLTQLAGKWRCTTAAGSTVIATYAVDAGGKLTEHQVWTDANGKNGGTWDQLFTYDDTGHTWNAKSVGSNGWVFDGSAKSIGSSGVDFIGAQNEGTQTVVERERFLFQSVDRFAHAWDVRVGDLWRPTSYAECSRY